MIGKAEIIEIGGQLGLNPHIVEKDYALSWLLPGIFANECLADGWVFRGGTCLKKCFFETYRISEDLRQKCAFKGVALPKADDLDYQGSTRRVEPYSLRRTQEGNIILHAWRVQSDAHRSYRIDRIEGARITNQVFTPRYAVELTPAGSVIVWAMLRSPASAASSYGALTSPRTPRRTTGKKVSPVGGYPPSPGPTYVYECGYCHKKFRHKAQDSRLKAHKAPDGWPCPGRVGWLVETRR